jgi:hypothetical protein
MAMGWAAVSTQFGGGDGREPFDERADDLKRGAPDPMTIEARSSVVAIPEERRMSPTS